MSANKFKYIEQLPTEALSALSLEIKKELSIRKKRLKIQCKETVNAIDNHRSNKEIEQENYSSSLSLWNINGAIGVRHRYYKALIFQDWSEQFPDATDGTGDFYVYAHSDPRGSTFEVKESFGGNFGGLPFYIGKGSGQRAYDLKRNQGHGKKLKMVLGENWSPEDIVHIAFNGLSEQKAFELESKLIYFFGTIYQTKRKKCTLYNLDIPKTPEFSGVMTKLKNKSGT